MFVVAFDHKRRAAAALFTLMGSLCVTRPSLLLARLHAQHTTHLLVSLFPRKPHQRFGGFLGSPSAFFLRDLNN